MLHENVLIMIPAEELESIKQMQQQMLELLQQTKNENSKSSAGHSGYITAQEFMKEIRIKRWKFDQLIAGNKIKTLKKKRKIYVPIGEVARYFSDPNIG